MKLADKRQKPSRRNNYDGGSASTTTYVDGEHVAGDMFACLRTTQNESSTIDVVCVRVDVTYLSQHALIVVHRSTACTQTFKR